MQPPWSPAPPPRRRATSRLAIVAFALGLAAFFGGPLCLLVGPNVVRARDAFDAFLVFAVISGALVVGAFVLGIVALVRSRTEDTGGKLWSVLAIVLAVLAPFASGVAAFFGLLVAGGGGPHGRPLRRRGAPVLPPLAPRGGGDASWTTADVASRLSIEGLAPTSRHALAAAWLEDARTEHASVATFARLSLDLLALGAPPDLVARAHEAARDEVHHARIAYAIASVYAGASLAPAPYVAAAERVDAEDARARRERVAREALLEGIVGEGACAAVLARCAKRTLEPALAEHLARLARDEAAHAALARDVLVWVAPSLSGEALAALADMDSRAPRGVSRARSPFEAHGRFASFELAGALEEETIRARDLVRALSSTRVAA